MQIVLVLLFYILFVAGNCHAEDKKKLKHFRYCIAVDRIDFNPFREIKDGKDLSYLLLLKSYISTEKNMSGILDRYEFSPSGDAFIGRVAPDALWPDGTAVSSREAAVGIAKTLLFRALGERVKVPGASTLSDSNLEKDIPGIKIKDSRTFEIKFESDISNLNGVIREALTTNSRHNRFWPVQFKNNNNNSNRAVVGKFPITLDEGIPTISLFGRVVRIVPKINCKSAEFSISTEFLETPATKYHQERSPQASAIWIQANSNRLALKNRTQIITWVRNAFRRKQKNFGIDFLPNFFLPGEPGYGASSQWPTHFDKTFLQSKEWTIAYEAPWIGVLLSEASQMDQIRIKTLPLPQSNSNFDAQILISGMQHGRHVVFQDILKWQHVRELLNANPLTLKNLNSIAKKSAATIPPDNSTLKNFEETSFKEKSFAPIARRHPIAYSLIGAPIRLVWEPSGELSFAEVEY